MGVKGKYFVLISKHGGKALDIKGGQAKAGVQVVLWDHHGKDNQVWFEEQITGTIRPKINPDLCLDLNGANRLWLSHFNPSEKNQKWRYNKERDVIENRVDTGKVLDVVGASAENGADVCSWDHHGKDNQRWKIDHMPAKFFYIKSKLSGKVLDVEGNSHKSGAKVIVFHRKDGKADNQLWFEDHSGNIRSKLNDNNTLDTTDGILHVSRHEENNKRKFWVKYGDKIVNVHNHEEVLDIKGSDVNDGAEVCAWQAHGGVNQQWQFEYI